MFNSDFSKASKISKVSVLTIGTALAFTIGTHPVFAAMVTINFCGLFAPNPGGVVQGSFVTIDTDELGNAAENFGLLDASIKTSLQIVDPTDSIDSDTTVEEYIFNDFTSFVNPTTSLIADDTANGDVSLNFDGDEITGWRFDNGSGTLLALFRTSELNDLQPGQQLEENNFITAIQPDFGVLKDKDRPTVPEPLTILGSVMAVGIGAGLKREHARRAKLAINRA